VRLVIQQDWNNNAAEGILRRRCARKEWKDHPRVSNDADRTGKETLRRNLPSPRAIPEMEEVAVLRE